VEKVNEADQWKRGGDCEKCRRKKYCSKACTMHKKRVDAIVMEAVAKKMPFSYGYFMR